MEHQNEEINCRICSSNLGVLFKSLVLKKHTVSYYKCNTCGFIQTEDPYWLEEAYSNAITSLDIGLVSRNLQFSELLEKIIIKNFDTTSKFIDYGGGYGLLVRLMRDKGFDFYRQDVFCENIFAKHFDITDIPEIKKFELLTAFEVFEHLPDPLSEIEKMFSYSSAVLFSTIIQPPENITSPDQWWYFVPETGQHISFYTLASLEIIAKKNNCFLYSDKKNLHLLTSKKLDNDPFYTETTNSLLQRIQNKILSILIPVKKEKLMTSLLDKDFNYIKQKIRP